jgi:5-methylcytosine-specific restriction endonuclease McrA
MKRGMGRTLGLNKKGMRNKKNYLLKQQNYRCFYCLCPLKYETATFDHWLPKSDGHTASSNIVVACAPCNRRKDRKNPIAFMRSRFKKVKKYYD